MAIITILIFVVTLFLAYANGANDNFKGVATLFGSGVTTFKKALRWATITTALGSLASLFLAQSLVKSFSGKGLIPDEYIHTPAFALAVALGAAITIMIATRIGMPVSTTHALVGALVGSGIIAATVNWAKLGTTFFIPLLLSPLIAATGSFFIYKLFRKIRKVSGISKESCACVGAEMIPVKINSTLTMDSTQTLTAVISSTENCEERYEGNFIGLNAQSTLNSLHYLSSGAVCFSRGLNDTPKMVGILLIVNVFNLQLGLIAIAVAIVIGGLLNSRKVAETMSTKITKMNSGQGFSANLVTAILVSTASVNGLPVSTTHVSVGSLFGIATANCQGNLKTISGILIAWISTLPIAALISAVLYFLFTKII